MAVPESVVPPIGIRYTCEVTAISAGASSTVTEIRGHHLDGMTNDNVEAIYNVYIYGLSSIGSIGNFFSNLLIIDWESNNLETLTAADLRTMPNLVHLWIIENNIVSLESGLFQYTPNLRSIQLSSNNIEHVGNNLLTGLNVLYWASFLYNPCTYTWTIDPSPLSQLNLQLPIYCPPLAQYSAVAADMGLKRRSDDTIRSEIIARLKKSIASQRQN